MVGLFFGNLETVLIVCATLTALIVTDELDFRFPSSTPVGIHIRPSTFNALEYLLKRSKNMPHKKTASQKSSSFDLSLKKVLSWILYVAM